MILSGRCYCGQVRFELHGPTEFASHCHCQSCRLSHGAAFVTWTAVARQCFHFLQGEELIRFYASSATVEWGFCSRCGSSMLYRGSDTPDKIYVTVASLAGLDRPVDSHVSYEEKVGWFQPNDGLPCYRGKSRVLMEPGELLAAKPGSEANPTQE